MSRQGIGKAGGNHLIAMNKGKDDHARLRVLHFLFACSEDTLEGGFCSRSPYAIFRYSHKRTPSLPDFLPVKRSTLHLRLCHSQVPLRLYSISACLDLASALVSLQASMKGDQPLVMHSLQSIYKWLISTTHMSIQSVKAPYNETNP